MRHLIARYPAFRVALAAAALAAASACAQAPRTDAAVPVYDSTQIAFDRYTVLRRVGITGSGSAFRIRGHDSVEGAQRAVLSEASEAGADGVVNLICFDRTDAIFKPEGYFCYGNAIKLKK